MEGLLSDPSLFYIQSPFVLINRFSGGVVVQLFFQFTHNSRIMGSNISQAQTSFAKTLIHINLLIFTHISGSRCGNAHYRTLWKSSYMYEADEAATCKKKVIIVIIIIIVVIIIIVLLLLSLLLLILVIIIIVVVVNFIIW